MKKLLLLFLSLFILSCSDNTLSNEIDETVHLEHLDIIPYEDVLEYVNKDNNSYNFEICTEGIKRDIDVNIQYSLFDLSLHFTKYLDDNSLFYNGYDIDSDYSYWHFAGLSLTNGKVLDLDTYVYFKTLYKDEIKYLKYNIHLNGIIDLDNQKVDINLKIE